MAASAPAPALPAPIAEAAAPLIGVPAMAMATTDAAQADASVPKTAATTQDVGNPAPALATSSTPAPTQDTATTQSAAPATTAQVEKQFTVPGRPAASTTTTQVGMPLGAPAAKPGGAGSIGGAVLALVLVVGLILVLGWLAKRMPGIGGASNPALKVIGSLSLSPRERVVVVAVGDTQLVLGTGAGGTRVLHQLDTPLPVTPTKAPPAFAQVLAQHFGKKQ
ncbi:flagellar protein FliO/FliZ [Pseudoxanthomonas sp. GM95]|uniref:flagellar biosynthetic protein FliO n=1 Tax=Pseudoxanthomonas sp. GM95 TaxID=1881043 RepID=UPI0008B55113|nr:flagellar biosynthetic protein FliO [Pseudoxanthomonas sp. GM95]SEK50009.1 flagellar protein FliO/FliZ [Pseudoxanthomonas sp. GM95]